MDFASMVFFDAPARPEPQHPHVQAASMPAQLAEPPVEQGEARPKSVGWEDDNDPNAQADPCPPPTNPPRHPLRRAIDEYDLSVFGGLQADFAFSLVSPPARALRTGSLNTTPVLSSVKDEHPGLQRRATTPRAPRSRVASLVSPPLAPLSPALAPSSSPSSPKPLPSAIEQYFAPPVSPRQRKGMLERFESFGSISSLGSDGQGRDVRNASDGSEGNAGQGRDAVGELSMLTPAALPETAARPERSLLGTEQKSTHPSAYTPFQPNVDEVLGPWKHHLDMREGQSLGSVYWKSVCLPAIFPVSIDEAPKINKFTEYFNQVSPSPNNAYGNDFDAILKELVYQRLNQRFQLVTAAAVKSLLVPDRDHTPRARTQKVNPQSYYNLRRGNQYFTFMFEEATKTIQIRRYQILEQDDLPVFSLQLNAHHLNDNYLVFSPDNGTFLPKQWKTNTSSYMWNMLDELVCGDEDQLEDFLYPKTLAFVVMPADAADDAAQQKEKQEKHRACFVRFWEQIARKYLVANAKKGEDDKGKKDIEVDVDNLGPGYVRIEHTEHKRYQWIELEYDRAMESSRCFSIALKWLVSSTPVVEDVQQFIQRKAKMAGLRMVAVPHKLDSRVRPFWTEHCLAPHTDTAMAQLMLTCNFVRDSKMRGDVLVHRTGCAFVCNRKAELWWVRNVLWSNDNPEIFLQTYAACKAALCEAAASSPLAADHTPPSPTFPPSTSPSNSPSNNQNPGIPGTSPNKSSSNSQ